MCMTRPFFVSHKNDLKNQEIFFDFLTYFTVCNAESGVEGTLHRIHPPTAFLALEKKYEIAHSPCGFGPRLQNGFQMS